MTSRVSMLPLDRARSLAEEYGISEQMAELSIFRVLLHQPALARCVSSLLTTLLFTDNQLDARLRELVIMRTGWVKGSVYEWTQHWRVARALDIPEEDLLAVRDWQNATGLSEADRAVLQATDDVLARGSIGDDAWSACVNVLASEAERVELVAAIATWSLIAHLLLSLEIPLEDGVEAWPPDGESPDDA